MLRDPSERVVFKARQALQKYDPSAVDKAMPARLENRAALLRSFQTSGFIGEYRAKAKDRSLPVDKRIGAIRSFRLYRVHAAVTELIALADAADDNPEVRRAALEALGWHVFSTQRRAIAAVAEKIAADEKAPKEVRDEARKTTRRIEAGANDALLP